MLTDLRTRVPIWTTLTSLIQDSTSLDSDDASLRSKITDVVLESMSEIGLVEPRLDLSGISTSRGVPDAYDFSEQYQVTLVYLMGEIGPIKMPSISVGQASASLPLILEGLEDAAATSEVINDEGREGVGQFLHLFENSLPELKSLRVWLVALGHLDADVEALQDEWSTHWEIAGKTLDVNLEIIDIPTLQTKLEHSSYGGSVDLHLEEFLGSPLKCLAAPGTEAGFKTFLAILPGQALADIYRRFGTRVLQKNLRNFLQTSGKVNKGIQSSLSTHPERFLAYNNGLTITASDIEVDSSGRIEVLRDFQIVNGGQTTASLDYAQRLRGVDLSYVFVQAKITVIDVRRDASFIDEVSRFANSQNKVKESDFTSRDNFHTVLESIMRATPEMEFVSSDTGRSLYWFYESYRGGYATTKLRLTGKQRKLFEDVYPRSMVIDKLLLAKCENLWDGFPYVVCRGADKGYLDWNRRTRPHTRGVPTVEFCQELVAKVLLLREAEKIVREQFEGFRSQIAAYSIGLMRYLLLEAGLEVNLTKIWQSQVVPISVCDQLMNLSHVVDSILREGARAEDPAQWAKKQIAWDKAKSAVGKRIRESVVRAIRDDDFTRQGVVEFSQLCHQVVEEMKRSPRQMTRREILDLLGVDDQCWPELRRLLLEDHGVIQTGEKLGASYRLDDQ